MLKYTPEYSQNVLTPITTPNKYIQSYFMRTDQSYYVSSSDRHIDNNNLSTTVIIDNNIIYVDDIKIETDCIFSNSFKNCGGNYDVGISVMRDKIYSILLDGIKQSISKNNMNDNCIGNYSVKLIFSDFFGRSTIILLIDIFINQLGFKEILLLPLSLSLSMALSVNNCAFLYKNGFSFIDDFVLVDSHIFKDTVKSDTKDISGNCVNTERIIADDEDFVEEFSRLKPYDDSVKYSCLECSVQEISEERIIMHIEKEHSGKEPVSALWFLYTDSDNYETAFENRIKFIFSAEKASKIKSNIYLMDTDLNYNKESFEGAIPVEDIYGTASKGLELFAALECSKDCWLTAAEWRATRIRALKEKLLFFI